MKRKREKKKEYVARKGARLKSYTTLCRCLPSSPPLPDSWLFFLLAFGRWID